MSVVHIQCPNSKNGIKTNYDSTIEVHSVPMKIHADCEADVQKYFTPSQENGVLKASLRGHPLMGEEIKVPAGYEGIILHESVNPGTSLDRKMYVVNTFKSLKVWNWGKVPSENDALFKAMEWIDIAEALHSPIDEE